MTVALTNLGLQILRVEINNLTAIRTHICTDVKALFFVLYFLN